MGEITPTLTYENIYRPKSFESTNKIKKNEKHISVVAQEFCIPPGEMLTCVGTLMKEKGCMSIITLNLSSGKLHLTKNKKFLVTTDTPAQLRSKYESVKSRWLLGTVTVGILSAGFLGLGTYQSRD